MQPKSKFALGRIAATRGAIDALAALAIAPGTLLRRHVSGDWGDLTEDDVAANESELIEGERVLSAYQFPDDVRLWVLTEWDRSCTTILLPEEY